jgi:DNA-directed RNA polymerase specialized sigma24 family protein
MQRKLGPPDEDDLFVRTLQTVLETLRRNDLQLQREARAHDPLRSVVLRRVRRFIHDQAAALHLLAARLVGCKDATTIAQHAIASLARRIWLQPPLESMVLVKAPRRLWRLTCQLMTYEAYYHLRSWPRDHERDLDPLERALDALPAAQRVLFILHDYYGFKEADFEAMFHLTKRQSQVLVLCAHRALKRAMGDKRVKQ